VLDYFDTEKRSIRFAIGSVIEIDHPVVQLIWVESSVFALVQKHMCDHSSVDHDGALRPAEPVEAEDARVRKMADAIRTLLECVGEDSKRHGLMDTPERYARAMLFFTQGYTQTIQGTLFVVVVLEDENW
jgi:hypothetical protein